MQRERQHQAQLGGPQGSTDPSPDPQREAARERAGNLLNAADATLDSLTPRESEQWLQDHRQRSAQ
ncbi:MAG: hypothetical protein K1X74_17305 [Pirellulales bacterium]|nr:hypothetical protein [Pirellulales bacterium]